MAFISFTREVTHEHTQGPRLAGPRLVKSDPDDNA
jgi:hypothetical protein